MRQSKVLSRCDLSSNKAYLVIGGDGLIGRALVRELRTISTNVYITSRRQESSSLYTIVYDLTQSPKDFFRNNSIQKIITQRKLTVFFLAAITKISECESDPVRSRLVNVTSTIELGKEFMLAGADVVFISSNAVFDGLKPFPSELDAVTANTNYGRQKIEAEQALMAINKAIPEAPALIITRLTKVVSCSSPLIGYWIERLRSGSGVDAFKNRILCPISLENTIKNLVKIAIGGQTGIYHVSGSQDISYYDFARQLAAALNFDPGLVNPTLAATSIIGLEHQYSALGPTNANSLLNLCQEDLEATLKFLCNEYLNC